MVNVWTPPTASKDRGKSGVAVIASLWIAGVLAFLVLCGVGVASCVDRINDGFANLGEPAVKPILIPRAACPYLLVVHAAAENAGAGWIEALGGRTPQQWRPFAVQLAPKLVVLENTLLVASVHVPRPVAADLADAFHQVVIGRPPLATSLTVDAYLQQTNSAVINGWGDLNHASALIGNACGFDFSPRLGV
jgi:hypothetical protein